MSKSKYPKQIDTSIELPIVRDNVTQITSELFNSLRSAILQVEKTLGIDPNGIDSITVAERLNQSLDELGNIKKEAIAALNLISGPITNVEVSDNASIKESKLDLDYNTSTLYAQSLHLQSKIESFIDTLNDFSLQLTIHLNKQSLSQHNALQIDVEAATSQPKNISTNALTADTLQNTLEKLYNQHINLTSTNITETNNSHKADQIFFDSKNLVLSATDVQGAIEEVSGDFGESIQNQFQSLNSSGRIRFSADSNPITGSQFFEKIPATSISFQITDSQLTEISFVSPQSTAESIELYDYMEINNSSENINERFKIQKVKYDTLGDVSGVLIFGKPSKDDDGGFTGKILKNNYNVLNRAGLVTTVRPSYGRSNSPYITVCNPNSATIISSFINAFKVDATTKNITIEVDGVSYLIDVYNASATTQTIESVAFKINTFAVDNKIPLAAFVMPAAFGDELVISHIIPNFSGDDTDRTIKLVATTADDATAALGLTSQLNVLHYGTGKNSLFLNGILKETPILVNKYDSGSFKHNIASKKLTSNMGDLLEMGIRRGDFIYMDLANSTDKGLFNILSVTSSTIELDYSGYTFTGAAQSDDKYYIIKSSVSLEDLSLEKVSGLNSVILSDTIFVENEIFLNKRAEYSITNANSSFDFILTDISKEYLSSGQSVSISVDANYNITLTDIIGNTSTKKIKQNGFINMPTPDGFSFLTFFVRGYSIAAPLGTNVTMNIFGFDESPEEVYLISRATYSYSLGFILGDDSSEGVPKIIDKRLAGTIKSHNMSEQFFEKIIQGPRNELRMSGIIRGCEASNVSFDAVTKTFKIDVSPGVYYSSGIRREFLGVEDFEIIVGPSFFGTYVLVFNPEGQLVINDTTILAYELLETSCILALLGPSSSIDLRFFINQHDKKILDRITVGRDLNNSHYTDLQKAVHHAQLMGVLFDKQMKVSINSNSYFITTPVDVNPLVSLEITSDCLSTLKLEVSGQSAPATNFGIETDKYSVFRYINGATGSLKISGLQFDADSTLSGIGCFISIEGTINDRSSVEITGCIFKSSSIRNSTSNYVIPILIQNVDSSFESNADGTTGNGLIVTNNKFENVGNEFGLIFQLIRNTGTWDGSIVVSNNVISGASPFEGITAGSYNIFSTTNNIDGSSIILPTTMQISVTGNTYRIT